MPWMSRYLIFLGVLVFLITAQSMLSLDLGPNEHPNSAADILTDFKASRLTYQLIIILWIKKYISSLWGDTSVMYKDDHSPLGECPAVEVLNYRYLGEMGRSPDLRAKRPHKVKFRVGQTVYSKMFESKGIIIGWDLEYKSSQNPNLKQEGPFYALLLAKYEHEAARQTHFYVPQNDLQLIKEPIYIDQMWDFFAYYDGAQYIMQPWLQAIYPMD